MGRDLPEITRDFTELGIRLDWLHPLLRVPVEWVGIKSFRQTILDEYGRALAAYGREDPGGLDTQLDARIEGGLALAGK